MTRVVDIRIERFDVYIGRRGKGQDGYFGNPFDVRQYGKITLDLYRAHFLTRLSLDPEFRRRVLALRDLILGCFCVRADGRGDCHGRIIAAFVDGRCLRCYGVFDDRGPDICACPKPIDARRLAA